MSIELFGYLFTLVPTEVRIALDLTGLPNISSSDKHLAKFSRLYINNVYAGNIFTTSLDDVAEFVLVQKELTGHAPVKLSDVTGQLSGAFLIDGDFVKI